MALTSAVEISSTGWSIGLSVLMILAGFVAIIFSPVAGIATELLIAWLLIFSGLAHIALGWSARGTRRLLWEVLLGLLYIVAGGYLLWHPLAGLVLLTFALAIYLFFESVLEFILAIELRPLPGSGWLLVDGTVTLILAVLIWRTWPWSTVWVIGMLVGISIFFSGISRLMLSLALRRGITAQL
jgi:uncharacterized membrane protein HdeD (DUF308 family)